MQQNEAASTQAYGTTMAANVLDERTRPTTIQRKSRKRRR